MAAPTVRVLLVDDHALMRAGVGLLLERRGGYMIVGEAANGPSSLVQAQELQPDLILLDLSLPGLGGLEVLTSLRKVAPRARILILTMHEDIHYARDALRQGAAGYVLKKAADTDLMAAIDCVMRDEVYTYPGFPQASEISPDEASASAGGSRSWDILSEREQAVLCLVALGHTSVEIGAALDLSPKTVETYRARGMAKLDLTNRAALVRFALQAGRIPGR